MTPTFSITCSKPPIDISYGTIIMMGCFVYNNTSTHLGVASYGGAISLLDLKMSVTKGSIKFHNNAHC